tara:strand:- start:63808 stop:64692 length:885 start_codon:yes stop_codon:yes gene_type:complete
MIKKTILATLFSTLLMSNISIAEELTIEEQIALKEQELMQLKKQASSKVESESVKELTETVVVEEKISEIQQELQIGKVDRNATLEELIERQPTLTKSMAVNSHEYFETTKKLEEDYMLEDELIKKFKEVVYPKKEFMEKADFNKEMNEYFLDALRTGRSNLALSIQFDSGAEIDVNGYSEELKNSPLMALATGQGIDGGDIEMFMRLVLEGAEYDYNKLDRNLPLISLAAAADNYKIVMYLISLGQNPAQLDKLESYPINYARMNGAKRSEYILIYAINLATKKTLHKIEETN